MQRASSILYLSIDAAPLVVDVARPSLDFGSQFLEIADTTTVETQTRQRTEFVLRDVQSTPMFRRVVEELIEEGLLPSAQFAIARQEEMAYFKTLGGASNNSLYYVLSCTQVMMPEATWLLFESGELNRGDVVSDIVPEFGINGKETIQRRTFISSHGRISTSTFLSSGLGCSGEAVKEIS